MNDSMKLWKPSGELNSEVLEEVIETFHDFKKTKIKYYKITEKDFKQLEKLAATVRRYCADPYKFTSAQLYRYSTDKMFLQNAVTFEAKKLNHQFNYDYFNYYRTVMLKPKFSHYQTLLINQNQELEALLKELYLAPENIAETKEELLLKILLDENADLFSWYRILNSVYLNNSQKQLVFDKYGKLASSLVTHSMLTELEDKADTAVLVEVLKYVCE